MAIFRAGKRIGNMDIRVGLPRDRSLENVEGDKRITDPKYIEERNPNQQTSIGKFQAHLNRGEGVARSNRFLVKFFPPKDILDGPGPRKTVKENLLNDTTMQENVGLMCTSIRLPHRDTVAQNFVTYGPGRKMPYAYNYGARVECMFMGDKFLRQRTFFETWQRKMHNLATHNLEYYDNYVGTMEIYQLGHYRENDKDGGYSDNHRLTYGVRLHEVYPETIGEIQYQSLTEDMIPMDIPINFAYRTWENLTIDAINDVDFGAINPEMVNIKPSTDYGMWGGILSKMPPIIKRPMRGVIEKIKRDIPIGKGTGGRVFPPYVINK